MRAFVLALAVALFVAAPPAAAQSTANVAGEWNATMNTPGGPREFKIVFTQQRDSLGGTVKRASGDVTLKGSVTGDVVRFEYTVDYGGNAITLGVTATVSGNTMKGSIDLTGGVLESFSAVRASAP
jgi:hypothetical protein